MPSAQPKVECESARKKRLSDSGQPQLPGKINSSIKYVLFILLKRKDSPHKSLGKVGSSPYTAHGCLRHSAASFWQPILAAVFSSYPGIQE
jgi:hypothetical protein